MQIPLPLVIVTVPPAIEHAPKAAIATGSPEEAVAETEKAVLNAAVGGGACEIVMI